VAQKRKVTKQVTKIEVGMDPRLEHLARLRDTTRRTGILNEYQVQHLKLWPLAFLNADEAEVEFGYETQAVIYRVVKGQRKRPTSFKQRLEHLDRSTKFMLGGEYSVTVFLDGKQVYHGGPSED
jgi:hypothetical protein